MCTCEFKGEKRKHSGLESLVILFCIEIKTLFLFKSINLFIYFGVFIAVHRLLIAVASLAVEHGG